MRRGGEDIDIVLGDKALKLDDIHLGLQTLNFSFHESSQGWLRQEICQSKK